MKGNRSLLHNLHRKQDMSLLCVLIIIIIYYYYYYYALQHRQPGVNMNRMRVRETVLTDNWH